MGRTIMLVCAGVAFAACARALGDADGPSADAKKARAEAMKATLDAIDQELKEHGGSFEAWGRAIKDFRDDLLAVRPTKWPWPAKDGFKFQGSSMQVILQDTLDGPPEAERPFDAVAAFDKQLKARGIDLIFVPLPDKLSIYPDYLYLPGGEKKPVRAPADRMVCGSVKHLMKRLLEADVEVVDLYTHFHDYRLKTPDKPLYYNSDSHWRNLAARLAGEKIAERLKRYDFVQKALAGGNRYSTQAWFRPDKPDNIEFVLDAKTGGRYADDNASPILIMGDSNLMYNMGATGGHMPAHVGRHIGLPLTFVAPTFGDAPAKIKNRLVRKRVIIWAQIARTLSGKWPVVDLGPAAGTTPPAKKPEVPPAIRKWIQKKRAPAQPKPGTAGPR